ncbi:hypothetical protein K438DRAFT_1825544 [Mycena galopus ATCC 62051]|nr:hypothetical protein K438DRAFT_1825544 [Mycena galopus ATCC 62051]
MASPFVLRLGTNYSPSDDEVVEIKSLLAEPTHRLKELDDKIAEMQKAIDKLAEERDGIEAYVQSHKALISPTRRLPPDIIQEIFIACLPTHRNCVISASEAPILLGRICSSWRALSLSTPRLWCSLHVAEPLRAPNDGSFDLIEIAKTWLGRSGQCPLSISLQSADGRGSPSETCPSIQILQTLVSFAPRWQHIDFSTPPSFLWDIMSYLDTDMPLLETVAFRHDNFDRALDGGDWDCGPFNMLRNPRISSFSVSGNVFMPEKFPLVWTKLTTLIIGGAATWPNQLQLTSDAIFCAISKCYGLQYCKLTVHDGVPDIPTLSCPIVELPFLHTLAVRCTTYAGPTVSVLLMRLSLPELRNFIFTGPMADSPSLGDFVAGLFQLETLDIDLKLFSKITLIETLRALPPTLQRLQIYHLDFPWGSSPTCFDDDTLAVLTSPGVCPALQRLDIEHGLSLTEDAVLRFITARIMKAPTTLNYVGIRFGRQKGGLDIMPSLQAFIEQGLTVSLVYLPYSSWESSPWRGLADAPVENSPIPQIQSPMSW